MADETPSAAAAPDPQVGGAQAGTAPADSPEATAEGQSQARPIRPIPDSKRQGAAPRSQPADLDLGFDTGKDDGGLFDRDDKGRFRGKLSQTDAIEREMFGRPEPAPVPADPAKVGEKPAAPPTPEAGKQEAGFSFAGKSFKSQAEAEQRHKSLEGMFKPMETRAAQAEKDRDEGYRVGHGWMQYARGLEAEVAQLKGGAQAQVGASGKQAASPASSMPTVDAILENIDADTFEQILVQGGAAQAAKFLAAEILGAVNDKMLPAVKASVDQALTPYQEAEAGREWASAMEASLEQLVSLRDPSGNPAFPELTDGAVVQEIGEMWASHGLPAEQALTGQGMITAIGLYRLMKGFAGPPETPAAAVPVSPMPTPAPGPAASLSQEPGKGLPANAGRSSLTPLQQQFHHAFDSVALVDTDLGFTPRPGYRAAR